MAVNLALQVFATIFMTGLVWFVHVVHYALYARVGPGAFANYQGEHISRTVRVVAPVMILEVVSAMLLLIMRPSYVPEWSVWLGLALLAVIWLTSFLILLPQHFVLARGFEPSACRKMMTANGLRTALWTARSVLVLWMLVGGVAATEMASR